MCHLLCREIYSCSTNLNLPIQQNPKHNRRNSSEIKTKNYISYLESFLIWFCEKEQHKESERREVRRGRANSSYTVRGQLADSV